MSEMQAQDTYIKLTDPNGKKPAVVNYHRTWDRERFIEAQRNLHLKQKDDADVRLVQLSNEDEYQKFRKGELNQ